MERIRYKEFTDYDDALEGFTNYRKKLNDYIENNPDKFLETFRDIKERAGQGDVICMDVLAYYYKSGVPSLLPENYNVYLKWEILSAARGNELAIEKLQFLLGYAYSQIMQCEDYEKIVYKNDIEDWNIVYVIGKAICKMLVKEMKLFPSDLAQEKDVKAPYTQEDFIIFRKTVDDIIPKTIDYMKS